MRNLIMRLGLGIAVIAAPASVPHGVAQTAKPYVYRDCGDPSNQRRPECMTKMAKPAHRMMIRPHHTFLRNCDDYAWNSADMARCLAWRARTGR